MWCYDVWIGYSSSEGLLLYDPRRSADEDPAFVKLWHVRGWSFVRYNRGDIKRDLQPLQKWVTTSGQTNLLDYARREAYRYAFENSSRQGGDLPCDPAPSDEGKRGGFASDVIYESGPDW
jgi:hypothetical protein